MKAVLKGNEIILLDSYPYKELIKEIPGRKWDSTAKIWRVPATIDSIEMLKNVIKLGSDIEKIYHKQQQLRRKTEMEKTALHVEAIAPMPIKVKAFQHQIKGYNMALRMMGVMR
ncbi:hypothetical protein SAMN05660297_02484 [Natronincola peptidivorans]|uniref:Uncharacterized protein n=1 Tax=Natronincola peptidivorans TaxID=426128 RepID=A0A1I0ELT6_9FIRM|nr:hypothetical protein [Natronincola peptidivorans]SET46415.1 hypothetical protein SAMN05660297_02484 [Natronincola peptidivorans]